MRNPLAKLITGLEHPKDTLRFLFGSPGLRRIIRLKYGMMYETSLARTPLAHLLSKPKDDVEEVSTEALDEAFLMSIYGALEAEGCLPTGGGQIGAPHLLYVICRTIRPDVVVETGVAQGVSTSFILKALDANRSGRLYSIDLPNFEGALAKRGVPGYVSAIADLPKEKQPGWVVPSELRRRWILRIGSSREVLPPLLDELSRVDLFLHDSEHSYENMVFEFRSVWPKLSQGGFLLSHDIYWNDAFRDFSVEISACPTVIIDQLGCLRKP